MSITLEEKIRLLDSLEEAAWANLQLETRNRQYETSDLHLKHIQLVAETRDRLRYSAKLADLQRRLEGLENYAVEHGSDGIRRVG